MTTDTQLEANGWEAEPESDFDTVELDQAFLEMVADPGYHEALDDYLEASARDERELARRLRGGDVLTAAPW